jgi:hypothetical protein
MESFGRDRSQAVAFNGHNAANTPLQYGVPQGSVLGPLLFLIYTADIIRLATDAGINVHAYADDIQLYTHGKASDESDMMDLIAKSIVVIEGWMSSNRLRLNMDKTQVMWFGSRQQLAKLTSSHIRIAGTNIAFDKSAKILGVTLDPELSMRSQVNSVTRSCFYQLRQIRAIRRFLTDEAIITLIVALVSSRIDYCNSIYFGSTDFVFSKLQSVMNAAARLVTGTRRCDHISQVLKDLHWLKARERVTFKLATLVFDCLHDRRPIYLREKLTRTSSNLRRSSLSSAQHGDLVIPKTRSHTLGARSFTSSAPSVWNALPHTVRNPSLTYQQFSTNLKTHLFNISFCL